MTRDLIVIGASAGGVEALQRIAAELPPNLPAAVLVVVHVPPHAISHLPEIIGRHGPLPAKHAVDGEPIEKGRIYVAPPNLHLQVKPGAILLSRDVRVNRSRPAVDVLFQSAARVYGRRVIGVILSGMLDDGTWGLMAVKLRGGVAVVQDPADALFEGMPSSALGSVDADYVRPLAEIPALLAKLAGEPLPPIDGGERAVEQSRLSPREIEHAEEIIRRDRVGQEQGERHGEPSVYSCPECGGVMWQLDEEAITRFQCHLGHAWSLQSLLVDQAEELEQALWHAVRSLTDKASLARQMIDRHRATLSEELLARYQEQADTARRHVETLKKLIESGIFTGEYDEALEDQVAEGEAEVSRDR